MKTSLWKHQEEALEFILARGCGMLAHEMGCGKTLTALATLEATRPEREWDARRAAGRQPHVLILAPKVVVPVWQSEIQKHMDEPPVVFAPPPAWTRSRKAEELETLLKAGKPVYAVLNYDSVRMPRSRKMTPDPLCRLATQQRWSAIICDESHRIKSPRTGQHRAAVAARKKSNVSNETKLLRMCLTGTPMGHSPLDIYGQFRFLNEVIYGNSFVAFRNKYAVTHPVFPSKVTSWRDMGELMERFYRLAHVVRARDVLDLPDSHVVDIPVVLASAEMKAYRELEKDMITWLERSKERDLVQAPANAAVRTMRCLQVCGGALPAEEFSHETGEFSHTTQILGDSKKQALLECLDQIGSQPVVVFARFRHDLEMIRGAAAAAQRPYMEISGRGSDYQQWLDSTSPDVIGVQVQSGDLGIDLTRAAHVIYYSVGHSGAQWLQSKARVLRPGQKRNVIYHRLVAQGTIEENLYHCLDAGQDFIQQLLTEGAQWRH